MRMLSLYFASFLIESGAFKAQFFALSSSFVRPWEVDHLIPQSRPLGGGTVTQFGTLCYLFAAHLPEFSVSRAAQRFVR